MLKAVKINNWRQFENIDIKFHPTLTIITGANGAGKTTILNTVNKHFGWPSEFVGTPTRDEETGSLKFISDLWNYLLKYTDNSKSSNDQVEVGSITYENEITCRLKAPFVVGTVYNLSYENQQIVKGLHIPSHRPVYKYQQIPNISTSVTTKKQAFNDYNSTNSLDKKI